jgi:hypothetical protein
MTYPASSLSPKSWLSLLIFTALLCGCVSARDYETRHRAVNTVSSRFEWGVQHFESGDYPKAIATFESLRKDGASVPGYDLIDYYVGMSHFHLREFDHCTTELEAFVRAGTKHEEEQDARVALLLTYEKLFRWKEIASLASESDGLTLFQNNRALVKLLWARALREQGELGGAKATLDETLPYLDKVGDENGQPFYADPDLWGRYHFTVLLVRESNCALLEPKNVAPPPKPRKDNKPSLKPKPKRLYRSWLEARIDCQRKAITEASEELFPLESGWTEPTVATLLQATGALADEVIRFEKEEASVLERSHALQKVARENFYRLLATIEEQIKIFKKRELSNTPLELLRKQVDRLLVAISRPS